MNATMSKAEQVLILEPKAELHFKGPFTDVVTSYLKLTNPSNRRVCFKVKTTAPKRYCVRPNNGMIEAHANTTIAVMLQPVDLDNLNDKNKHKFMVQTMFAPEGDVNQELLWKEVNPDFIMDSKLKCVFDLPNMNDLNVSLSPNVSLATSNSLTQQSSPAETVTTTVTPIANKSAFKMSSTGFNEESKKLTEENKRLRDEIAALRNENMQLREDGLKHRMRGGITSPISEERAMSSDSSASNMKVSNAGVVSPQLIGIAFIILIVGVLLGKVLF